MMGRAALYNPGCDHAGIATQVPPSLARASWAGAKRGEDAHARFLVAAVGHTGLGRRRKADQGRDWSDTARPRPRKVYGACMGVEAQVRSWSPACQAFFCVCARTWPLTRAIGRTHRYGDRIYQQIRKMGTSVDWDRAAFTMDEVSQGPPLSGPGRSQWPVLLTAPNPAPHVHSLGPRRSWRRLCACTRTGRSTGRRGW